MKPSQQALNELATYYPGELVVSVSLRIDEGCIWEIVECFDRQEDGHPKTEGGQNHIKTIMRPLDKDAVVRLAHLFLKAAQ